jgi:hypothetical protein
MAERTAPTETAQKLVEERRQRIARVLGYLPSRVAEGAPRLPEDRLQYLVQDAEELYWNELSWEEITDEEAVPGGHLTEMVFPGFLAFVNGVLVEEVPADSLAPASPHPDVVEEILLFLAGQHLNNAEEVSSGADSEKVLWAREMSGRLVDLVLYRLHGLSPDQREQVDAGTGTG